MSNVPFSSSMEKVTLAMTIVGLAAPMIGKILLRSVLQRFLRFRIVKTIIQNPTKLKEAIQKIPGIPIRFKNGERTFEFMVEGEKHIRRGLGWLDEAEPWVIYLDDALLATKGEAKYAITILHEYLHVLDFWISGMKRYDDFIASAKAYDNIDSASNLFEQLAKFIYEFAS